MVSRIMKKQLKRIAEIMVLILSVCLLSLFAEAKVYKWKDDNGLWQYSDIPPVDIQKTETMKTQKHTAAKVKVKEEVSPEQSPVVAVDVENAKVMQKNCEGAKANLNTYAIGGRIRRANQQGEMVYLNEQEIEKAKRLAQKQVEQYCR